VKLTTQLHLMPTLCTYTPLICINVMHWENFAFFIFDSGSRIVVHVDHVVLSVRNTGGNISVTEQPFCFGNSDWIQTVYI